MQKLSCKNPTHYPKFLMYYDRLHRLFRLLYSINCTNYFVNIYFILYILNKINMDLTNSQITQVVLETEMMNYFSLQQFLSQLMESKFLTTYKESDREYYSLTQKGLEILEYFLSRIPEDLTNKIDEYVTLNRQSLLSDTEVKSSFIQQNNNEFIVNLRVIENQSNLIDLNLNVSSEKQAQQICDNWKNNASYMYAEIIDLLIKENH